MRVRYTPEFIAHIRHRYEDTDEPLVKIAADCGMTERTLHRIREREGWSPRSERPARDLPPATRALKEATDLLAERIPIAGEGKSPPSPAPSPPLASPAEGAETIESPPGAAAAMERIERLVEKELAAEEAMRARLGPLPRPPGEAERAARTLATLTQTLHTLQRLRCGVSASSGLDDDDDMPRDIDEFRRDLARRIDAFVASRTKPGHADGNSRPGAMDAAGAGLREPGA
jgi:hypothetical protein